MSATVLGARQIAKTSVRGIQLAQNLAGNTALAVHSLAVLKLFITVLDGRNLADNWLEFKEKFQDQGLVLKAAYVMHVGVNACRLAKCLGALNVPYFSTLTAAEKTIPLFGFACTLSLVTVKDTSNTLRRIFKSIEIFLNPQQRSLVFGPDRKALKKHPKDSPDTQQTDDAPPPPPTDGPSPGSLPLKRLLLLAEFSIDTGKIALFVFTGGMGLVAGAALIPATGTTVLIAYVALEALGIAFQIGKARLERQQNPLTPGEASTAIQENITYKLFACEWCFQLLQEQFQVIKKADAKVGIEDISRKFREIQEEKHIPVQETLHEIDILLEKLKSMDMPCHMSVERLQTIRHAFGDLYLETNRYCESSRQRESSGMMESGDIGE